MATTSSVFDKEALITTIVPAPSCYSSGWIGTAGAYSFGTYTTSVNYYAAPGCFPYHTGISHLFSPGICPGGWTTALMTVKGATTAQCCPTGYDKYNGDGAGAYCRSVRTESMSIDCVYPTSTGGSRLPCVQSLIGPGAAVIFAYTIAYESSDLSRFPSGYTPGTIGEAGGTPLPSLEEHTPGVVINVPAMTSPATPGASARSTIEQTGPTGGTSNTNNQNPDSGQLTTGAKAGIGVGAAIGVLLLLGAILFCLKRRRRNRDDTVKGDTKANRDDEKEVVGNTSELHYFKGAGKGTSQELELDGKATGNARTELDGASTRRIVEADTHAHTGAELPGQHEQRWQELPSEKETASTTRQPEVTHQNTFYTALNPHPSGDGMSATALGPVSLAWDGTHQGGHSDQPATNAPVIQAVENQPQTIEEIELRYLENEERRIRERKEALLAGRRQ